MSINNEQNEQEQQKQEPIKVSISVTGKKSYLVAFPITSALVFDLNQRMKHHVVSQKISDTTGVPFDPFVLGRIVQAELDNLRGGEDIPVDLSVMFDEDEELAKKCAEYEDAANKVQRLEKELREAKKRLGRHMPIPPAHLQRPPRQQTSRSFADFTPPLSSPYWDNIADRANQYRTSHGTILQPGMMYNGLEKGIGASPEKLVKTCMENRHIDGYQPTPEQYNDFEGDQLNSMPLPFGMMNRNPALFPYNPQQMARNPNWGNGEAQLQPYPMIQALYGSFGQVLTAIFERQLRRAFATSCADFPKMLAEFAIKHPELYPDGECQHWVKDALDAFIAPSMSIETFFLGLMILGIDSLGINFGFRDEPVHEVSLTVNPDRK